MFLKRSLVLVIGVILFIGAFLLKFRLSDARMESRFKQERVNYGLEGVVLTAPEPVAPLSVNAPAAPPAHAAAPVSTPAETPAPSVDSNSGTSPSLSGDGETPAPGTSSDPNAIIGPVPPANVTPDSAPAPATPDATPGPASTTNAAPATPNSTMNEPRANGSPFLVLAAYDANGMAIRMAGEETAQVTNPAPQAAAGTNPAPVAPTNAATKTMTAPSPAVTNTVAAGTNSAPAESAVLPHATSAGARAIVLGFHQFTGPGVHSSNPYSMSQDVFEEEMKYLQDNGYHVVPLSDVVRFIRHEIGLPSNAVAITIDDGYKSALNYAAPVLKQYGYPWTFFVYPQFITRHESKGAASWPDLVDLDAQGVDVECHSMTHPILSSHRQMFTEVPANTPGEEGAVPLPNGMVAKYVRSYHQLSPQEYDDFLTNETLGAKTILERELGKKIKYFAYPYGSYNKEVEAKVIAAGFEAIFTVAGNPVHITTDIHSIGRYIITKPVERSFASYLREGLLGLAEVDPAPGATTSNPRPVISAVLGFNGDPASIETDVRDYGTVRHDFDPQTSTVRLYLPRDLIQPEVVVSIHAKDAQSGRTMAANWSFNYEPAMGAATPEHQPIPSTPLTNGAPVPRAAKAPAETPAPAPVGAAGSVKSTATTP